MPTVVVHDHDRGYTQLTRLMRDMADDPVNVVVGILAASAQQREQGGATVLDVAIWNEFGTDRIPARSFVRAWFDEHRTEGMRRLAGLMRRVVARRLTQEQALEQFGLWAQGSVQAYIARGIPPPNAESTIARKGSSKPLINTGQLRTSVQHATRKQ